MSCGSVTVSCGAVVVSCDDVASSWAGGRVSSVAAGGAVSLSSVSVLSPDSGGTSVSLVNIILPLTVTVSG